MVRIEDTDVARSTEGADEVILDVLRWLGLDWDEGPQKGGEFGPYYQSQRLPTYQRYAQRLLEEGHAYCCYCAPERLEQMRRDQQSRGEPPRYDRRCRDLSDKDRSQHEAQGTSPVVRLKTPMEGETSFHDLLRGEISFANSSLDDFVLLKSDGYPTYHLANVVDDHLMEVSDVLRADEWIPSAPRHILLYQAFGWDPPRYIHLPLILDKSGGKMSKRLGEMSIASYRERGYLSAGMVNYLALLGWSPGDTQEIFSPQELIDRFSWERISVSPAIFDPQRLNWFNRWYIVHSPIDEITAEVVAHLRQAYGRSERSEGTPYSGDEWLELLVENVREEVDNLGQMPAHVAFAFLDQVAFTAEAMKALQGSTAKRVLAAFLQRMEPIDRLDVAEAMSVLQQLRLSLKEKDGLEARQVLFPIRASLTGSLRGPSLAVVMALLGTERCMERVISFQKSFRA